MCASHARHVRGGLPGGSADASSFRPACKNPRAAEPPPRGLAHPDLRVVPLAIRRHSCGRKIWRHPPSPQPHAGQRAGLHGRDAPQKKPDNAYWRAAIAASQWGNSAGKSVHSPIHAGTKNAPPTPAGNLLAKPRRVRLRRMPRPPAAPLRTWRATGLQPSPRAALERMPSKTRRARRKPSGAPPPPPEGG